MFHQRPRRNRKSEAVRAMARESTLSASDLIPALFVIEGEGRREPVVSMPGVDRLSIDQLLIEATRLHRRGVAAIILFPVVDAAKKDPMGSEALSPSSLYFRAIRAVKKELPSLCLIADLALDPYTSHGHDGVLNEKGEVANDPTVALLGEMALFAAEAGADMVAPSDMMDGRVGFIRKKLDENQFSDVSILAYSAKYASAFYGPFRDALHSAPRVGDKKGYQMDPANGREAVREVLLDIEEGADIVMVKPALAYLDILYRVRETTHLPVAAFHVSGEYSMIMAAAERGWLDRDKVFWESHIAMKRAGADLILTYAADLILDQIDYSRSA